MCSSIPGQIIEIIDPANRLAQVEISGKPRSVNLSLLSDEESTAGAWVLVQAGLAVTAISPEEAGQILELVEALDQLYKEEFS
jgi:hydrogenase expression/formation protein HypC